MSSPSGDSPQINRYNQPRGASAAPAPNERTNFMMFRRMMRWLVILASTCAVAAGVALVYKHGSNRGESAARAKAPIGEISPVAVTVAPVTPRPIQRSVQIVGTFYGHDEVDVEAKASGRVTRILHDIGDVVRPGEVLLEIDPTDYRLAVAEMQRSMELELARLGLRDLPGEDFDVTSLPTVVRAAQEAKNAKSKYARRRAMKQFTTGEELEQMETEAKITQANHQQAVIEAEATLASVRQRQAALATATQKLEETRVVVPQPSAERLKEVQYAARWAGLDAKDPAQTEFVVSKRLVSEGEMIHATSGSAVFHLVMDRPLKLLATVPERHVGEIKIGQRVEVSVEAYPGEMFDGVVSRMNPTVDHASRTFQLEVMVANPKRRLKAGSFAKASVLTHEDSDAPTIPEEALVTFAGVTKVFVVADGRAQAVPVRSGVRLEVPGPKHAEHWVEALGELPLGAEVVTSGQTQLADGTPVRLRGESVGGEDAEENARAARRREAKAR